MSCGETGLVAGGGNRGVHGKAGVAGGAGLRPASLPKPLFSRPQIRPGGQLNPTQPNPTKSPTRLA